MTTRNKKNRINKLLALCLSAFMVSAAGASLAACGSEEGEVDQSEVTQSEVDSARIKNGSFEFFDDNGGKNLIITSPTGWSKSTGSSASGSASSSQTASGIVDTAEDAWKQIASSSGLAHSTEADARANWDNLTARDKLEFYQTWEEENEDGVLTDLDFYDADEDDFNIDFDDIEALAEEKNPGTHYGDEATDKNSHVLMLHNSYTDGRGTAQKYTSSTTITLQPGTGAKFSVWVKTMDLTFGGSAEELGSSVYGLRGAYIGITHTVGGNTLDQMQIKNIDTSRDESAAANNGWVQYTVYLKGCSYASSTFTVVLGLGQGGGTDKFEYVDGYAFFDDAECTVISYESFDSQAAGLPTVGVDSSANEKLFQVDDAYRGKYAFAVDLYADFESYTLRESNFEIGLTEEKGYVSAVPQGGLAAGQQVYGDLRLSTENDLTALTNASALKTHGKKVVREAFENYPFENEDVLMLLSADGAAYTAKLTDTDFVLQPDARMTVSFWLKTSDIAGFTGAGVIVYDKDTENTLSNLDTTSISTIDIDGDDGETVEDVYDGWQQCFLFLENDTETEKTFSIAFTYGTTSIIGSTNSSYYGGFAAFANFEVYRDMSAKEFGYAATGTYAQSVSLVGDEQSAVDSGFDNASLIPYKQIENNLALPKNYTGVNGGSQYVVSGSDDRETNGNPYAGLVNKAYAENYLANAADTENYPDYWLNKVATAAHVDLGDNWWKDMFGTATQPLVIYHDEQSAYGYFGAVQTVSASSYATISVKVKVGGGASAYLYLIDSDDKENVLSVGTVAYTYWYDSKGNVCASDPSDPDFDEKTDVAFKLNTENGLYEVNPKWENAAAYAGKYFANLSNYERDEATGNLLVKEGGVSYNYNSKWKNQGNDGVAFYYSDGKYYAYENHTVEVNDLATVEGIRRYDYSAAEDKSLMMKVDDTDGQWVTCTFYLHTGSESKNYRLEVWSGTRDGSVKSPAGSYVFFDASSPDSADSVYADLVNGEIETIKTANGWSKDDDFKAGYAEVRYYAFSFYDTPAFLRYDSTLDENDVGNSYASYDATSYPEGVIYLYSVNTTDLPDQKQLKMFVDFSYIDVSVTPDSSSSSSDSGSTTTDDSESNGNMWLFISSLVVAAALIVAVIGLAVQKILQKTHIKKARAVAADPTGATKRRRFARKNPETKSVEKPVEKKAPPKDENDPYND